MATKHYYAFAGSTLTGSSLLSSRNWDALRVDATQEDFSFEATREAYERACAERSDYASAAKSILDLLGRKGLLLKPLVSLGAGKGILEWHLKRQAPSLDLMCTDYAPESMQKLAAYFPACEKTFVFDMVQGDYLCFGPDATLLMYRISTEFDALTWRRTISRIHAAGIRNIVFVPTEVATLRIRLAERLCHWKALLLGRRQVFCGWLYSDREIRSLFEGFALDDFLPMGKTAIYLYRRIG